MVRLGASAPTASSPGKIAYDLKILKPWKSQSNVAFHIDSHGKGASVTWTMDGSLPFHVLYEDHDDELVRTMPAGCPC